MAVDLQKEFAAVGSLKSIKGMALCLILAFPTLAYADGGEVISTPVSYATYVLVPGKLTGDDFFIKAENLDCKIFSFDQFRSFPKPAVTVSLPISLRGGYRAHDIFGHDDFVSDGNGNVATGWVPQGNGNFIIFPDDSKQHLPQWVAERTRLIRVPFIQKYGDTEVNAYDLALGLDRFNTGDAKSQSIDFKIVPITDDNGKQGKRLVPSNPLAEGVYYAYSLPDDKDTENYGFLFAVGSPASGSGTLQADQGQTLLQQNICLLPDVQLARDVIDYAKLSAAVYDDLKSVPNWEKEDDGNCPIWGMKCWEDIGIVGDGINGFHMQVYRQGKILAVVFQGTVITKPEDVATDALNFFNFVPGQYVDATNFVQEIVNKAGSEYKIILTGHSLGGGLASFAALCCGQQAVVFNAANLGSGLKSCIPVENLKNQESIVKNISLAGDPVSAIGNRVGTIYTLQIPPAMIGKDGFVDARSISGDSIAAFNLNLNGQPKATTADKLAYHSINSMIDVIKIMAK